MILAIIILSVTTIVFLCLWLDTRMISKLLFVKFSQEEEDAEQWKRQAKTEEEYRKGWRALWEVANNERSKALEKLRKIQSIAKES